MTIADWRASRIILIGQAPGPTGPPPGRPLVGGKSGTRMQMLCGCEGSLREYIKRFETMNVLDYYPGRGGKKGDRFPMTEARVAASQKALFFLDRTVVYIGSAVAEAFDVTPPVKPFEWWMRFDPRSTYRWAMVPHPSPVNQFWNDPANVARARAFFAEAIATMDKRRAA